MGASFARSGIIASSTRIQRGNGCHEENTILVHHHWTVRRRRGRGGRWCFGLALIHGLRRLRVVILIWITLGTKQTFVTKQGSSRGIFGTCVAVWTMKRNYGTQTGIMFMPALTKCIIETTPWSCCCCHAVMMILRGEKVVVVSVVVVIIIVNVLNGVFHVGDNKSPKMRSNSLEKNETNRLLFDCVWHRSISSLGSCCQWCVHLPKTRSLSSSPPQQKRVVDRDGMLLSGPHGPWLSHNGSLANSTRLAILAFVGVDSYLGVNGSRISPNDFSKAPNSSTT